MLKSNDELELVDRAIANFEGFPRALFVYAKKCGLISEEEKTSVLRGEIAPDRSRTEEIYFTFACFILLYFGEEF